MAFFNEVGGGTFGGTPPFGTVFVDEAPALPPAAYSALPDDAAVDEEDEAVVVDVC